jgi:hypothetical protein
LILQYSWFLLLFWRRRSACLDVIVAVPAASILAPLVQLHDGLHLALRDGDGDVIGEEVPEHERLHERGDEERGDGERGDHGECDAERLGEAVVHHGGVADGGDGGTGHGERVGPPGEREPEAAEEVDLFEAHGRAPTKLPTTERWLDGLATLERRRCPPGIHWP